MPELPRLRALRDAALLTQDELAEKAKVAVSTLRRIEAGHPARIKTVRLLAAALEVKPQDLIREP